MFFMKNRTTRLLLALKVFVLMQSVKNVKTEIAIQDNIDLCSNFVCKWGGMCQLDGFGFPVCNCPLSCPGAVDVVCSIYEIEFQSECEMHRFACAHVISISIKNKGSCHKNVSTSEVCPNRDLMRQFRDRYMGWIVRMKAISDNPFVSAVDKKVDQLSLSEKINTVKWQFIKHDKNNNGVLDDKEIKSLLQVMEYEPCGYGFIRSCAMVDGRQGINLQEWNICFNVADRPYERHR